MLKNCEVTEKYQIHIKDNGNLKFGLRIEKENVVYRYSFYKHMLKDLDSLLRNIDNKISEDVFIYLSNHEMHNIFNVLKDFKEEVIKSRGGL